MLHLCVKYFTWLISFNFPKWGFCENVLDTNITPISTEEENRGSERLSNLGKVTQPAGDRGRAESQAMWLQRLVFPLTTYVDKDLIPSPQFYHETAVAGHSCPTLRGRSPWTNAVGTLVSSWGGRVEVEGLREHSDGDAEIQVEVPKRHWRFKPGLQG